MTYSVLIADDDHDLVELLAWHCTELGFTVRTVDNAIDALQSITANPPDVAILDLEMPSGSGLSVQEMMFNHVDLKKIPVILLTGNQNEEVVRRCWDYLGYYVLKCPGVWYRVEPVLRELFPMNSESPVRTVTPVCPPEAESKTDNWASSVDTIFQILGVEESNAFINEEHQQSPRGDSPWVLTIDDDDDLSTTLRLRLQQYGIQAIRACNGTEGYRRAFLDLPRAIILDYEMPQGGGDYVLRRLKESTLTRAIPVIVLTGRRDRAIEHQMRSLGAAEFLNKPLDWNRLRAVLDDCLNQTVLSDIS